MDKISQLPDELLVKVLLFLPTKFAVRTSVLSKRWEFLWMWLPKLEYDYSDYSVTERQRLRRFINLNLPLHRAPVIESLRLKFWHGPIKPKDIKLWVLVAVSRSVLELSVSLFHIADHETKLPSSLYICKSIVILKLKDEVLVDVPRTVCLPSLKTLFLRRVAYSDENSLHKLLSNCPVLEDLVVERDQIDCLGTVSVFVQSLQRLTLKMSNPCPLDGLMINTPSLRFLKVTDDRDDGESDSDSARFSYHFEDMPKLEEAEFILTFQKIDKFFGSITSVKRLSLCLGVYTEKALYREGIVFNQLEHLKLCPCDSDFSILLARLLMDSPNLRELDVYLNDDHPDRRVKYPNLWEEQLDCVPECLLSSLETFKWTGMYRSEKEMDVAKYILSNACFLKTATILFHSSCAQETADKMIKELLLSFRGSTTCQFIFG